jgi:hypothetical protein
VRGRAVKGESRWTVPIGGGIGRIFKIVVTNRSMPASPPTTMS